MGAGPSAETLVSHHLVTQTRCGLTSALVPAKLSFLFFPKPCPTPTRVAFFFF